MSKKLLEVYNELAFLNKISEKQELAAKLGYANSYLSKYFNSNLEIPYRLLNKIKEAFPGYEIDSQKEKAVNGAENITVTDLQDCKPDVNFADLSTKIYTDMEKRMMDMIERLTRANENLTESNRLLAASQQEMVRKMPDLSRVNFQMANA